MTAAMLLDPSYGFLLAIFLCVRALGYLDPALITNDAGWHSNHHHRRRTAIATSLVQPLVGIDLGIRLPGYVRAFTPASVPIDGPFDSDLNFQSRLPARRSAPFWSRVAETELRARRDLNPWSKKRRSPTC